MQHSFQVLLAVFSTGTSAAEGSIHASTHTASRCQHVLALVLAATSNCIPGAAASLPILAVAVVVAAAAATVHYILIHPHVQLAWQEAMAAQSDFQRQQRQRILEAAQQQRASHEAAAARARQAAEAQAQAEKEKRRAAEEAARKQQQEAEEAARKQQQEAEAAAAAEAAAKVGGRGARCCCRSVVLGCPVIVCPAQTCDDVYGSLSHATSS
jgi:Spy/CpxP family protein refolding chaperone